jgi:formate dehydrogenase (NADP+) beta subunit
MPGVTGRVCLHPCETACNRGKYDSSIAIHSVERFLGDMAVREGWDYKIPRPPASAPQGSDHRRRPRRASPTPTTCCGSVSTPPSSTPSPPLAAHCAPASPTTGLPDEALDPELERIFALGVEFRPHQQLGRDMILRELQQPTTPRCFSAQAP